MNFGQFLQLMGKRGWFDLASVVQLSGERRETLRVQLHRWSKAGKLLSLRRGMYAFAEEYRREIINVAELANELYAPSYLSLEWALGYHGLIPEKVVTFTSATTRTPKRFQNSFGTFRYRHLKPSAFFGYRRVVMDDKGVMLAEPEKALLDFWHLEKGEWGAARMAEMRFQNFDVVEEDKLRRYAGRFETPRISTAVGVWMDLAKREREGTVEL